MQRQILTKQQLEVDWCGLRIVSRFMKWSQVPWGEGWAAGGPSGKKLFLWKELIS